MENEYVPLQLYEMMTFIVKALVFLLLWFLDVTAHIKILVEMVHNHAKKVKPYIDSNYERLINQLINLMKSFE